MSDQNIDIARPQHIAAFFVLQLLGLIAILTLPTLFLGHSLWSLHPITIEPIFCFGASYLVCTGILLWRARSGRPLTAGALLAILALGYVPTLLFLLLAGSDLARRPLVEELVFGAALVCVTAAVRQFLALRASILLLAAAGGIALQILYLTDHLPRPQPPGVVITHVDSALYALKVTEYVGLFPKPKAFGGGITRIGDVYLLATGDGDLFTFTESTPDHALNLRRSPYKIPVNTDAFVAAVGTTVDTTMFRAADILVQEHDGQFHLFASHHFWKQADQCFVERISELDGSTENFMRGLPGMSWKTIYETSPCVPVIFPGRPAYFNGAQAGGRLALLNNGADLLATIGDNGLDGWYVPMSAPQDMASSYGKTVLIHLSDLSNQIYSFGHRNPQGLYVEATGTIWSTEHGPQGGDELNRIERGANYGWPLATYGTQYGTHTWPFDPIPGNHDGFTQPFYSFVPSIGISNLLVNNSPQFGLWKGDLLISSLRDRAIYRLRIRQDRVVMVERFPVGRRIRDIQAGRAGELLLWTDSGTIMIVRVANDADTGDALFDACAGCHAIQNGRTHGMGPDLYGVVNRPVASAEGFHYSPAMQAFGGKWTKERLDAFLASPRTAVPGTAMQFNGLSDATSRAKLIEFLQSGTKREAGGHVIPD